MGHKLLVGSEKSTKINYFIEDEKKKQKVQK